MVKCARGHQKELRKVSPSITAPPPPLEKKEKDGRYEVFEVHKQRSNKQFSGNKGCKSCN